MFRLVIFKKDIKLFFSWIESCDFNITSLQSSLQYTVSKCPGGHPILHHELKLNPNISAGKYKKNEVHRDRGQLIFHRGAKQKLCLKNAEIPWNMLLLWPKSKAQGKYLTI